MFKISSIIIAKNEESNIQRCIESQRKCIDEIIVIVDEESDDNTLEILKSFAEVKCSVKKWQGYAKTKQYAASLTSSDWVLWIDADEELTKGLSDEIIEFKNKLPEYAAYSIPRKAFFLGRWIKHSGWYPGRVTRLFDKNKSEFDEKDVHENLVVKGDIGELKNDINHYTDPNIHHYFVKFNRYTTLAAEELFNKGKSFLISDIILRPLFIFLKMFILKRGFLDGVQGFILAVFSSAYV
ncbi:MAG: glycosyltransferase family 2 protein, partial [Ignavibacteriaceae bacterium]